jgi:hypothetical protein
MHRIVPVRGSGHRFEGLFDAAWVVNRKLLGDRQMH